MNPDGARTAFEGKMLTLSVQEWNEREYEVVERADSVASCTGRASRRNRYAR